MNIQIKIGGKDQINSEVKIIMRFIIEFYLLKQFYKALIIQ